MGITIVVIPIFSDNEHFKIKKVKKIFIFKKYRQNYSLNRQE